MRSIQTILLLPVLSALLMASGCKEAGESPVPADPQAMAAPDGDPITGEQPGTSGSPREVGEQAAAASLGAVSYPSREGSPPPRFANAPSPGKPTAPVELQYALQGKPAVGRQLDIALRASPRVAVRELKLMVSVPDGIVLGNLYPQVIFTDRGAGEVSEHLVSVIPQQDGFFHLNVVATVATEQGSQSRPFSIPVVVGDVAIEPGVKPLAPQRNAAGEPVISMPAIEAEGRTDDPD